jgi:hypothetical protein
VIEANASRFQRVEWSEIEWTDEQRASRPVREYLAALDGEHVERGIDPPTEIPVDSTGQVIAAALTGEVRRSLARGARATRSAPPPGRWSWWGNGGAC